MAKDEEHTDAAGPVLKDVLLIAAGGALGALGRWAVSLAPRLAFPWHTLAVNLVGALLIGLVLARSPADGPRFFFVVGFLGAFTTLSTYSMETVDLLRAGQRGLAAANVATNALGGPLLAWLGWSLGQNNVA